MSSICEIESKRRKLEEINEIDIQMKDNTSDCQSIESHSNRMPSQEWTQTTNTSNCSSVCDSVDNQSNRLSDNLKLICGECKKSVENIANEKLIQCKSCCHKWFHLDCIQMREQVYNLLIKYSSIKWICNYCLNYKTDRKNPLLNII